MQRLDRYLLTQCAQVVAGLTALALGILLLERLLRIFELVSNATDTIGAASRMLLNLIPYYLGLAIPVALFLGVLVTVDRVSRTGELSASLAAGVSLTKIVRPFVLIATALALTTILVMGFLQPLGRYDYRATLARVQQTSFEAAFQEGKFAQIGRRVFWTEDRFGGDRLGKIFIYEKGAEIGTGRVTTAPSGVVGRGVEENETRVTLNNAQALIISDEREVVEQLNAPRTDWNVAGDIKRFRDRGDDERELTLFELMREAGGNGLGLVEPHVAAATVHAQLGRALMLLTLPFIALPMGLGYGRSFQSTGIAVGIVILLVAQKSLETGHTLAAAGTIAPWLGTWPVFFVLAGLGAGLFLRSAFTVSTPPLMLLSFDLAAVAKKVAAYASSGIQKLTERLSGSQST